MNIVSPMYTGLTPAKSKNLRQQTTSLRTKLGVAKAVDEGVDDAVEHRKIPEEVVDVLLP